MHVMLPKVRKSDGKLVNTAILAHHIAGTEPHVVIVNGQKVQGCKVFGPNGTFHVPVHPMLVMQAQAQAIATQQPVMIETANVQAVMLNAAVKQLSYADAATVKMLAKGN